MSNDIKGFQGMLMDFKGFLEISRDIKGFQDILMDFNGLLRILRDFVLF